MTNQNTECLFQVTKSRLVGDCLLPGVTPDPWYRPCHSDNGAAECWLSVTPELDNDLDPLNWPNWSSSQSSHLWLPLHLCGLFDQVTNIPYTDICSDISQTFTHSISVYKWVEISKSSAPQVLKRKSTFLKVKIKCLSEIGMWGEYECNNKQDYYDYNYYKLPAFSRMTFGTESDKPGEVTGL